MGAVRFCDIETKINQEGFLTKKTCDVSRYKCRMLRCEKVDVFRMEYGTSNGKYTVGTNILFRVNP